MGAAQSAQPRSVSINNPGLIDLSDEVVQRLRTGITEQIRERIISERKEAEAATSTEDETEAAVQVKKATQPTAPIPAPASTPEPVYHQPTTIFVPVNNSSVNAMDVRRQREQVLKDNDKMWRQRMTKLEENLKKTNEIMEKECETAYADVRNRFATASEVHQLPPCQDLKAKLITCFKEHKNETLYCSEEVAQFRKCVDLNRVAKLDVEHPVAVKTA